MGETRVRLELVESSGRLKYLPYLIMADESETVVKEYIAEGQMFVIILGGGMVGGVALFVEELADVVELKNIALDPQFRGLGLGKQVIDLSFEIFREQGFRKMMVGTANSSIANLAFYQKAGFRMAEIRKDFFLKYPEPIFEDGIQAVDMVVFERVLQ
ncbi:GNAT family N-acetyltransferase [Sutcliffiella horikoshii]|uniref:GNAT family N-acetyltransferase n=1 Tax=Sutcliffiella horikoshii TaxID=79883 RepID=A0ABN4ZH13_9BACI|nr:GNAT family N-acetyltransferase [Sutcliffiella horikoshii]ART75026.1 GNAT family N-acetyltransferase [Sutcliffiella horikoshii]